MQITPVNLGLYQPECHSQNAAYRQMSSHIYWSQTMDVLDISANIAAVSIACQVFMITFGFRDASSSIVSREKR